MQIQCPECKVYKAKQQLSTNKIFAFFQVITSLGIGLIMLGAMMTFVGLLIWPLLIISIPMALIGGVIVLIGMIPASMGYLLDKEINYKCSGCGLSFRVSK